MHNINVKFIQNLLLEGKEKCSLFTAIMMEDILKMFIGSVYN